jgi:hypothetical protein
MEFWSCLSISRKLLQIPPERSFFFERWCREDGWVRVSLLPVGPWEHVQVVVREKPKDGGVMGLRLKHEGSLTWNPVWDSHDVYVSAEDHGAYRLSPMLVMQKFCDGKSWEEVSKIPSGLWTRAEVVKVPEWRWMSPAVRYWMMSHPDRFLVRRSDGQMIMWARKQREFLDGAGKPVLASDDLWVEVRPSHGAWEDDEAKLWDVPEGGDR